MDNDDEKRSRGIPSRTTIGKRGSIIEKFPALGEPLVIFGGLISIPFWGYLNTPVALMEVMMADLPHVMYNPKDTYTQEEAENRRIIEEHQQKLIKQGGLRAIEGLNLNFENTKVVDGDALLAQLNKK